MHLGAIRRSPDELRPRNELISSFADRSSESGGSRLSCAAGSSASDLDAHVGQQQADSECFAAKFQSIRNFVVFCRFPLRRTRSFLLLGASLVAATETVNYSSSAGSRPAGDLPATHLAWLGTLVPSPLSWRRASAVQAPAPHGTQLPVALTCDGGLKCASNLVHQPQVDRRRETASSVYVNEPFCVAAFPIQSFP